MKLKHWELALLWAILAAMLFSLGSIRTQSDLAQKLTRLHVLANSDSEADQALKLKVRDAVLRASEGETVLDSALLDRLEQAAEKAIRQEGKCDPVRVTREYCYFDTRVYDSFSLPAGYYDAVRVVIGEGKGHNWWCVIYPPLCAGVCEKDLECIAKEAGLTDGELALICEKDGYVIRFQLADWWGRLIYRLKERKTVQ